jgi:hypothetical protein
MKSEQINSYTEIKQRTDRDVRQVGVLASDRYETESTASQTVINLPFTVSQTVEAKRAFQLFVDGTLLREGATNDFQFTNILSTVSSQVTLNIPIVASLNIIALKLGGYVDSFPNPSSVTATLLNDVAQPHKMALDAFQPFVKKTFVNAPSTTILNRAQVEAGSLKAIMGVERVPFRSIALSRTEFGSAGEPVFELDNKDSRIRFVGSPTQLADTNGTRIRLANTNDTVEISFYGTGLNLLSLNFGASLDFRITVDNNPEGSNIVTATQSSILSGRNYNPNQLTTLVSGLTAGQHTVKLRMATSANQLDISGIEILNQRTDLAVLAGTAYSGMKQEVLPALSTAAFNAGVVGTRGARVVKYLKDGVISQAVQEVNAASAFLTSADHTNEEIVRKINFREFGANRADDFSLGTTTIARGFTLDDGTTTLTGASVGVQTTVVEKIFSSTNGSSITLTFVGTGIDFIRFDTANAASADTFSYSIDGVVVGTISGTGLAQARTEKVASGLPYGTHTFKMSRTSAAALWDVGIVDFIIYQPKKPVLPVGAIEVADYNVIANYVATASGANGAVGTGILRKNALREITPSGAWSAPAIDPVNFECGFNHNMTGIGSYIEYSFYGTGVIFTGSYATTQVQNALIIIDGASNLSAFSTSIVQGGSGAVFTASTGAISGTVSGNNIMRIQINGLSLGLHKIRVTQNTASGQLYVNGFDVITPIHINTNMKVGSLSLRDTRAFSPIVDKPELIDLSKAKAWVVFDQTNAKILSSFNISQCLQVGTGNTYIYFAKPFKSNSYAAVNSGTTAQVAEVAKFSNYYFTSLTNSAGTNTNGIVTTYFFGELEREEDDQ